LRTFRLPDPAFAALAAGRPSAETLGELRKAQLSRHLLLLRELLRAAGDDIPSWYAADPSPADLADPLTGLYASAALAAVRSGAPPPDRPSLVPSSAGAAGRLLEARCDGLTLRVRLEDADPLRGRLGLTPTGRLDDAGIAGWRESLDAAWRILVRRHRAQASVLAAVLRVIIPVEPDPAAGGISATSADAFGAVAMSAPADGAALAVGLLHETQHSILNAVDLLFDLVRPSGAPGCSPWRDDPRPPFGILHGAYAYLAVTRFWRTETAAPTGPGRPAADASASAGGGRTGPPGGGGGGGSGPPGSGRSVPPGGDGSGPAEGDGSGPAEGDGSGPAGGGGAAALAAFEFARWRAAVVDAADGLLAGDALTPAGRRFTRALRQEAAGWLIEPVAPEVARLAAGANADHRARWRLRNLTVDATALDCLIRAWRSGAPPPPLPEPAVRPAPSRELEHSTRLGLVHAALRGADRRAPGDYRNGSERDPALPPGSGVRPGDDAYLRADHGTAVDAYLKDLEGAPADPDAWSGLALVSPWRVVRERPELVRAAYLALGDADVGALADWLAG
jgi:hypothetical protein